jgi:glycosyltransferase involved in cell wall biosynthesis
MKSTTVYALPSNREGFGLVALEANACGTPVVTTNHADNAAKDLIDPGRNGLLCDRNEVDLAAKLDAALEPSTFPDRDDIRRSVASYDWDVVAASFEEELFIDHGAPTRPTP